MNKAIFLDRDGTIIEDTGYIGDISQVEIFPFAYDALKELQNCYLLFIVSNQSGIAKGIVTKAQVNEVNKFLLERLEENGIRIVELYYCPHKNEDQCICKKPKSYFLELAAKRYKLDLSKSWMIGDHPSDVICATNAGAHGIYLLSGHGLKHASEISGNYPIKENLMDAANFILSKQ